MFFEFYHENGIQKAILTRAVKTKIKPNVEIPAFVGGIPVCRIALDAFANCKIESVEFPESIEDIGIRAFMNCTKLESIKTYTNGFTQPAMCLSIRVNAFHNCTSLKTFKSTTPVRLLEDFVFHNCKALMELDAKVMQFYSSVFENCDKLSRVIIDENGTWRTDSFVHAKSLKRFAMLGTINVSQSALRVIKNKSIECTPKFNHLHLAYEGAKIYVSDDALAPW